MARATLTKTNAPGYYASTGAALTLAAADVTNKNEFVSTGKELVVAQNTGASSGTVTINSTADPYGRTEDITDYSIDAGGIAIFGPFPTLGWQQSDGKIYLEASTADIKFGVIVLP
ncbi:MAG: hypothetical protein JRI54_00165 [Deltaproteobacteria bacterium]|nr:hypothetical protein [Deltaproteobacteria bacterium]